MSSSMTERKLRIAFFFPSFCVTRPVDVANIWASPRGLTGSELACVMYALGLSKLGHGVTFFTRITGPGKVDNVAFLPYEEWAQTYRHQGWDALCSWMVPEPLKLAKPNQFRFLNQQCSNLSMFEPGWESYVDLFTPLSHHHANHMADMTSFPRDRWRVLHNGVDMEAFRPGEKEPGKMVWASSHDRGLHWLLEAFPQIRKDVPRANLHVFYNFEGLQHFSNMSPAIEARNPTYPELARRSRYTLDAFRRLKGHGVHVYESVSRDRIRSEMVTAEVLAYPCDPVLYTETFGVTVLEACASGTVPVLCTADAFGELWGSVGLNVPPPYAKHKDQFVKHVTDVLSDAELRERMAQDCVSYAREFDWPILIKKLERCLLSRGENGLADVVWDSVPPPSVEVPPSGTVKLNIGCGPNLFPFPDWINYDRSDVSDYLAAVRQMTVESAVGDQQKALVRFVADHDVDFRIHDLRDGFGQHPDGSVDAIYLGQTIEHLNPLHEAPRLIRECRRMLKPGGVLRIATPDLDLLVKAYVEGKMAKFANGFPEFYKDGSPSDQLAYVLYGSAGADSSWDNYDGHMHLYTQDSMARLLRGAGFEPPFFYYLCSGESRCPTMANEVMDASMGYSFISEAVRK